MGDHHHRQVQAGRRPTGRPQQADLSSLHATCDRIAAIARGKVIATGTLNDLLARDDPWLQAYFSGECGRTIFADEMSG